jgi:dynein heavy chain
MSDILDGDVEFAISRLKEAIHCGIEWKVVYHKTVESIARQKERYGRCWEIDEASIFAQIDAFVQRCRDLLEVCESQMQFVRKSAGTPVVGGPGPIPHFGGTKAQEIVEGINGIQISFEQHIDRLRALTYDVLDVKISKWHDDYNRFKNDVKDLEVMYTNVINAAFEHNSTVAEGVLLTETFQGLAKRDAIKRCVERKATETNNMFLKQSASIRGEFEMNRLNPPLRLHEPQYAGSALWAHSLGVLVNNS